jgi:hypothetical protein
VSQNGELKKFNAKPSGRSSIISGAKKYCRGFVVRPEQILSLFHDTQPGIPLPKDAQFQGIGIEDAGIDSRIQFFFTSVSNPSMHCFSLKPNQFFSMLVQLADGLLPLDSELDGVEVSSKFTMIMLRVQSSHWPAPIGKDLPLYHLRYDLGRLMLVDPIKILEGERRIRIQ